MGCGIDETAQFSDVDGGWTIQDLFDIAGIWTAAISITNVGHESNPRVRITRRVGNFAIPMATDEILFDEVIQNSLNSKEGLSML